MESCCSRQHKRIRFYGVSDDEIPDDDPLTDIIATLCPRDRLCDVPEDETYLALRAEFEKENMRVEDPFCYLNVRTNEDGTTTLVFFKHVEFRRLYSHMKFTDVDFTGNLVQRSFIDAWLCDAMHKAVLSVVVDPRGERLGVYNAWSGFRAAGLDSSACFPNVQDAMEFAISPIFLHLKEVIANEERANWILDWLANIVQRPWQKTNVAIVLLGEQLCDFFAWVRQRVLGAAHTFQTENPRRDLFGRFSDVFVNKVLVQIDNVKNVQSQAGMLSDAITNTATTWESRRGGKRTDSNISNFVLTSREKFSSDNRGFAVFQCSSVQTIADHLQLPGVDAWFFKFLMRRDLSNYPYDFQCRIRTI